MRFIANRPSAFFFSLVATLFCMTQAAFAETTNERLSLNLSDATLLVLPNGDAQVVRANGEEVAPPTPMTVLYYSDGAIVKPKRVENVRKTNGGIKRTEFEIVFTDGARASYRVSFGSGYAFVELLDLVAKKNVDEARFFNVGTERNASVVGWINTTFLHDDFRLGVMTTSLNAIPLNANASASANDREGCSHTFKRLTRKEANAPDSSDPSYVAEFAATSSRATSDGWSVRGVNFNKPLDLTGCAKLRARICGDGKLEHLKIQLGGAKGHRDDYIPIDFNGWKVVELDKPALNDLTYDSVVNLSFYYNSSPANTSVRCLIDRVEAVLEKEDGATKTVVLEDFSDASSPYFDDLPRVLYAKSVAKFKTFPASCALIASTKENWAKAVQAAQKTSGVPSPRLDGKWRGESERLHENYFFLTYFNVNEYDRALAFAKRGGFKQILLLQNSWCESTGHYRVNEKNFPGGLPTLKKTIERFNAEGIRFGLHLLGASVDANDPYLSPVPDKRFLTGYSTTLAADLTDSNDSTVIKTTDSAQPFPTGQDEYMGSGQFVRIDDEIIKYGAVGENELSDCRRGCYGTKIAEHKKGARVAHFIRAYGYHLPDLDTDFIDEIAANFAKVANAVPLDMIYFDGSELLQRPGEGGDHWHYNARLHKAFYDALDNKNILFQASSCSPYSWHMIARNASADGHDDLKAYLEERSGGFTREHPAESYLDVGWYYAYDKNATPDMYEYCLGATIAYDASFSFQTSVSAAETHPFIGEILDMIKKYQEVRLSGRVPEEMCKRMELDKRLSGKKSIAERRALLNLRREFHLEEDSEGELFRRVKYPVWHNACVDGAEFGGTTASDATQDGDKWSWTLEVDAPSRLGFQTHFTLQGDVADAVEIANPKLTIALESDPEKLIGSISLPCRLSRGQYASYLPGEGAKKYGAPLSEPQQIDFDDTEIRLSPGVYRVTFAVENGKSVPVRVRTPLYTDETYRIPK